MSKFKLLKPRELESLAQESNTLLLDCRKIQDYKTSHIKGALHSHDKLVESIIKEVEKDKTIIIYCYHGHSSEHLAELFCGFGFSKVYSLEGGFENWAKTVTN